MKPTKRCFRALGMGMLATLAMLHTGCIAVTSVDGITPVYPQSSAFVSTVDSLQPELRWKGGDESKKYDVAIWNSVKVDSGISLRRKMIYEKTGLAGTAHKVELLLEPGCMYYWSVRETGSATWSSQHLFVAAAMPGVSGYGRSTERFCFYTPTAEELAKKSK